MKFTRRLLLLVFAVFLSLPVCAQNPCSKGTPFRGCKACGKTKRVDLQALNVLKNRGRKATSPQQITVAEIRDPENDDTFTASRKVSVTGFVASVVPGGNKETCNCKRANLRDVHINIVADPSEVGTETKYVIVEFTPRWEKKFNFDDSDYNAMLEAVKTEIEGKWVKFEGYMMNDFVHANQSETTAPGNSSNWRATPWEVHPVTAYTVVTGP